MSNMIHNSFDDLYKYLVGVSAGLKARGADDLAEGVFNASRLASGLRIGLSTEFLGKARIALQRVVKDGHNYLTVDELAEMQEVLNQLTNSINRWQVAPKTTPP